MNSIFLRARHWQIFVPLLAIPFVTMIVFGIIVAIVMTTQHPQRPHEALWIAYCMPFVIVINSFVQFAWFWNVLIKLRTLLPSEKVHMPIGRIKLFFAIPILYFCCIPLFVAFIIQNAGAPGPGMLVQMISIGIIVFFVHLFAIFCFFHTIYFAAKTIRSAELQRNATFSDFAGDFFLIWLFPIGIWFIQPRINKLIDEFNGLYTDSSGLVDQF